MIDFPFNEQCYGCGLCEEVCPVHAITMQENGDGFRMPVVDTDKCINCRKCEKFCIRMEGHEGISLRASSFYACWQKDKQDRLLSTSGGAFICMARSFIEKWGGVVCGCVWNKDMEAEIVCTETVAGLERMRGSKYVQSSIRCYPQIRAYLKDGRKVLFCGTPCQVGAVRHLFPKTDNLYTIALFCEGVPSPKAWRYYVREMEEEMGSKMVNAIHRKKKKGSYGWLLPYAEFQFENGKTKIGLASTLDPYVRNMMHGFFIRNSCCNCEYKGDNSSSDIMIGDYWGLPRHIFKKTGNAGCSVVVVNTAQGRELFDLAHPLFQSESITLDSVVKRNPPVLHPSTRHPERDATLADMEKMPFTKAIQAHCGMNNKKAKRIRLLHRFHLAGWVKQLVYPYGKD